MMKQVTLEQHSGKTIQDYTQNTELNMQTKKKNHTNGFLPQNIYDPQNTVTAWIFMVKATEEKSHVIANTKNEISIMAGDMLNFFFLA